MPDPESMPQADPTTTEGERTGAGNGPAGESPPAAALVLRLADQLAAAGVRYCHWKNTAEIMRSLSGENDLDLLVARRDATRFESVLHELGFRLARPAADRQVPGILDFYGLDEESARSHPCPCSLPNRGGRPSYYKRATSTRGGVSGFGTCRRCSPSA